MSVQQGTVISIGIDIDVAKNGGGTYKGWELVYRTPEGKVQTLAKPIQSLRFNAELKTSLEALEVGDEFTAQLEKNANGFLDVKSLTKGLAEVEQAPREQSGSSSNQKAQAYSATSKSTYETPEERKTKQVLIVRQSSIAQAVGILSIGAKAPLKVDEVVEVAQKLTEWVYAPLTGVQGLVNMESDIPE